MMALPTGRFATLETGYSFNMDNMYLVAVLRELRDELELVEGAITSLEHLAVGQGRRRGRPPSWMKQIKDADAPHRVQREDQKSPKRDKY
jgi:hypothetical protein